MIYGIGCDILEIDRVRNIMDGAHADTFVRKVLTEAEKHLYEAKGSAGRKLEFLAGRFAAKEAVSKALGCGICGKLGMLDIEITQDPSGRPQCCISERSRGELGLTETAVIHISISHSSEHVVAYAVAES